MFSEYIIANSVPNQLSLFKIILFRQRKRRTGYKKQARYIQNRSKVAEKLYGIKVTVTGGRKRVAGLRYINDTGSA